MQAVILAAGMGKRLKELTSEAVKCMVKVNGSGMIDRMLGYLDRLGLSRIVVVTGYESKKLMAHIDALSVSTPIEYVDNDIYDRTNNIWSLCLAKDYLLKEDTLLLESDLVFEEAVLKKIMDNPYPSLALVDKFESWMDGTVVTLDEHDGIKEFVSKREFDFDKIDEYYKTVNIYKFSREFSELYYVPFLEAYCKAMGTNEYYEQVLKLIVCMDNPPIKAVRLDGEKWYEIDDAQDLDIAENVFLEGRSKLERLRKRRGGYWRYPKLLDYCNPTNPFFPNKRLMHELKSGFETLVCRQPSGIQVNSLVAAKSFGLKEEQTVTGNGIDELVKIFMHMFPGKQGVIHSFFAGHDDADTGGGCLEYIPDSPDFTYTADEIMNYFEDREIQSLLLANPDKLSGNYIGKPDLLRLVKWAAGKGIRLVIDESFADFADAAEDKTLLEQEILNLNPQLLVVKSISDSCGVPGLRLGIAASGDRKLIAEMKKDASMWNINSLAEFYMQIFEKYKDAYRRALLEFQEVKRSFIGELQKIEFLRVLPSQTNFVLCKVLKPYSSGELAVRLLERNILIKELSDDMAVSDKQYVRIAVRNGDDNERLLDALKNL